MRWTIPHATRMEVECAASRAGSCAQGGSPELRIEGCHADVAYARSLEELRWAREFVRKAEVEIWCHDLAIFDWRSPVGIPLASARWGGADTRENRAWCRDERRWLLEYQCFVFGAHREGSVLTNESIAQGLYARCQVAGIRLKCRGVFWWSLLVPR